MAPLNVGPEILCRNLNCGTFIRTLLGSCTKSTHIKLKSVSLIKHHTMKVHWGIGGTSPCIINLGTRLGVSGQIHTMVTLQWENNP